MSPADGCVLVLCTGNICRSPIIERLLAHALADTSIEVTSAGTGALVDHPIHESSARRLDAAGVPSSDFAARQLTPEMVKAADLIVAATREHVGGAAQLHPSALRKGFALLDLADLIDGVPDAVILAAPGATRAAKVAAEALVRRGEVQPRTPEAATIVDPYMQDESVFDAMDTQVRRTVPIVARALRGA